MKHFIFLSLCLITVFSSCEQNNQQEKETGRINWPEITQEMKPWTRWWWHGSAVTEKGLTASLESYQEAGLGGVEITPIYGVKGEEGRVIDFLSSDWIAKLVYTLKESQRFGLGVDLANASGWPFGGPWVNEETACKYVTSRVFQVKGGQTFSESIHYVQKPILRMQDGKKLDIKDVKAPLATNGDLQEYAFDQVRFEKSLPLIMVSAHKSDQKGFTETIDLTDQLEDGKLTWAVPAGEWVICALFEGLHGKQVERAGPGGEGNVIDHFSRIALDGYLDKFDTAFKNHDISYLRYYFNDSYEVDDAHGEANWTPDFFTVFQQINGYDLRNYIPALLGLDTPETNSRVIYDYRMTISDLLLENYTKPWQKWAGAQGKGIRNQAHGSPANVLDLYAASDVPEIEGREIVNLKSAASAAHVTGKKLISSESATWLNEHFESNWGDVKNAVDNMFLSGVNHIFYHGTAYSPQEAMWPGWLFYAAVHFAPTNSLWGDFKTLNQYVARSQSFLQAGRPANDILVYFNIADHWSERGNNMLKHFHSNTLFDDLSLKVCGDYLSDNGYSWDAISDKQLQDVTYQNNQLLTHGNSYKTILIPEASLMPAETFEKLISLANEGATLLFVKDLPEAAPGMSGKTGGTQKIENLKNELLFKQDGNRRIANYGKGLIVVAKEIPELITHAGVQPESFYIDGLQSIRRAKDDGNYYYFIKNTSDTLFKGWITLQADYASAALYNPMTGAEGYALTKSDESKTAIYVSMRPEESIVIETFKDVYTGELYPFYEKLDNAIVLSDWKIDFVKGGPILPESLSTDKLQSWTIYGGDYAYFSGTAEYTTTIPALPDSTDTWLLHLDNVNESAAIYLNNEYIGTLLNAPYELELPVDALRGNSLKIAVSNLMANRIAYMDKQGVTWRKFYNINFAARRAENRGEDGLFSARNWKPKPSGLSGDVILIPLKRTIK
ncbi:glycosyl hydrolase [Sphingobacterium chuzhouense]|uniref:Glycoside hydrolase family 2 protein n=1 Tax=Sphingobacterium chuzhouense TaxID=1742264 RepID=A0ABR7XPP4_9SPHI|nr:glycosyl hydrolase [Sphingobacterium chuzhouense]MBD1420484.1 glycoside hydrolase family 2 protein [Sphingobacterium chuzhouense]